MKEVMAIIRMGMINRTKDALSLKGFDSLTCLKVKGRGKKKVNYELIEALLVDEDLASEIKSPELGEAISEGHRLIPKRLLLMVVDDEDVEEVVQSIINVNQSENPGDGKIFVTPVEDAFRVRTGEQGAEVI